MSDLGVKPAPGVTSPMATSDFARLLGVLYVLEGSSLGARLLYKRALSLGLTESFGARHLAQQTASNDNWLGFLRLLELSREVALESIVQSAQATFLAAERAFKGADDGAH